MKFRAVLLSAVALIGMTTLSGCSGGGSAVTINYDDGLKVNATFKNVECSDTEASAVSTDPTNASINVHFDADNDNFRGRAWVYADDLVSFEADRVDVSKDGNRLLISGEGTVKVAERAEGEPAPGAGFDTDNAVETTGTLEAELTCSN